MTMDLTFAPPSNSFAHYHHHHDPFQGYRYETTTGVYHQQSAYYPSPKQIGWPSSYSSPPMSPLPLERQYSTYSSSDPDCDETCMPNTYYTHEMSRSTSVTTKEEPLTPDAVVNGKSTATYINVTTTSANGVVRVVKRRVTANKKERRRTQSINSAFSNLRDCIPNVPADTKLSKIKTLRLATSYIAYLMELLDGPSETSCKLLTEGFRADLAGSGRRTHRDEMEITKMSTSNNARANSNGKVRCRTGWPQHVWALELKQHDA